LKSVVSTFSIFASPLVHRDADPDHAKEAVVVNVFLGEDPPVVNVQRP
jgi:hypothetical protein